MWKEKNPNMPNYIGHDLYTHNFSYAMRNLLKNTPHSSEGGERTNFSPIPSNTPDRILSGRRAKEIKDVIWPKKPTIITVTPSSFENETLSIMMHRNFGYKILKEIPRDSERMETQRKLANIEGKNEPTIIVKTKNGLKLIEGWHRTMTILMQGAPENQLQIIKLGHHSEIDFSKWTPVKINAYVGTRKEDIEINRSPKTAFDGSVTADWNPPEMDDSQTAIQYPSKKI